jgi:hypothetical protein
MIKTIGLGFFGSVLVIALAILFDLSFLWIPGTLVILSLTAVRVHIGEITLKSEFWFRTSLGILTVVVLILGFI